MSQARRAAASRQRSEDARAAAVGRQLAIAAALERGETEPVPYELTDLGEAATEDTGPGTDPWAARPPDTSEGLPVEIGTVLGDWARQAADREAWGDSPPPATYGVWLAAGADPGPTDDQLLDWAEHDAHTDQAAPEWEPE